MIPVAEQQALDLSPVELLPIAILVPHLHSTQDTEGVARQRRAHSIGRRRLGSSRQHHTAGAYTQSDTVPQQGNKGGAENEALGPEQCQAAQCADRALFYAMQLLLSSAELMCRNMSMPGPPVPRKLCSHPVIVLLWVVSVHTAKEGVATKLLLQKRPHSLLLELLYC